MPVRARDKLKAVFFSLVRLGFRGSVSLSRGDGGPTVGPLARTQGSLLDVTGHESTKIITPISFVKNIYKLVPSGSGVIS